MSIESLITVVLLAIVAVAIFYVISIWVYKRAPANMASSVPVSVEPGYAWGKVPLFYLYFTKSPGFRWKR
jgi:hypothetical protein